MIFLYITDNLTQNEFFRFFKLSNAIILISLGAALL